MEDVVKEGMCDNVRLSSDLDVHVLQLKANPTSFTEIQRGGIFAMSFRQDEEHAQTAQLLVPTPEYLGSVKVFPLIPNLKKDIMVSLDVQIQFEGISQY